MNPTSHPAVTVMAPAGSALPIVIDSPHSGTTYPADFGSRLVAPALRGGEDTHVDTLYAGALRHGATLVAAQFPRAYIDPNRSLLDIDAELLDEPWPGPTAPSRKTELGIGLVWRLMRKQPIYDRRLGVAEVQRRIDGCWRPYHAALQAALDHHAGGPRWHLNVHSMPDDARLNLGLPPEQRDRPLADVVLGNLDGTTSDARTMAVLRAAFEAHGYSVDDNDPFKGVEIIRLSGQPARGWHSVQIELKRSLYMDAQLQPNAGFERMQAACEAAVAALAAHVRSELAVR
jgi:N-formylglutamate deformylase